MDFTREPIIETIITPKEGYKLVIRSSKSTGQEEYFVDAVEVVAFGHALFFRSLERPKAFIVPVSDYEVLEVREARIVLKNAGLDRSIKIGGGKEAGFKAPREEEKVETSTDVVSEEEEVQEVSEGQEEGRIDVRVDKKRDRRRNYRKRRGREEGNKETSELTSTPLEDGKVSVIPSEELAEALEPVSVVPSPLSSLLQPPPTLISETINRYRQNDLFKGAFYLTEEDQYKPHGKVQELLNEEDEEEAPRLQEPDFDSEETSEGTDSIEQMEVNEAPVNSHINEEFSEKSEEEVLKVVEHEKPVMSLPIFAQEEDVSVAQTFFHVPSSEDQEEDPSHHDTHTEEDKESDEADKS